MPIVSVGMPVLNGQQFIGEAIKSVLEQTYDDLELIISDNASTDHTEEICCKFFLTENRVRDEKNSDNIGAAKNYNPVFKLANNEYFRLANADDLIAPQQCNTDGGVASLINFRKILI